MKQIPENVRDFTSQWRKLQNVYNQYARKLGLTTSFIDVLDVIYEKQPCTQKDVMDALFLPKQTVSFVVKKLKQNRYIEMKDDPEDKRRNWIVFTKEGNEFAENIIVPFVKKEEEAMLKLPVADRKNFTDLLAHYVAELDQAFGKDGKDEKVK